MIFSYSLENHFIVRFDSNYVPLGEATVSKGSFVRGISQQHRQIDSHTAL